MLDAVLDLMLELLNVASEKQVVRKQPESLRVNTTTKNDPEVVLRQGLYTILM